MKAWKYGVSVGVSGSFRQPCVPLTHQTRIWQLESWPFEFWRSTEQGGFLGVLFPNIYNDVCTVAIDEFNVNFQCAKMRGDFRNLKMERESQ